MRQSVIEGQIITIEVVSDNEVKVDLLDINAFMNLTSSQPGNCSTDQVPGDHGNPPTPATGTNTATPTEAPRASDQDMSDIIWQWNVLGNVDPEFTSGTPIMKCSTVDFKSLGPIYCIDKASKNKHQLDITSILNAIL